MCNQFWLAGDSFMTPCRTEKVDFSKKTKTKTKHNQKPNQQKNNSTGRVTRKIKKKQKTRNKNTKNKKKTQTNIILKRTTKTCIFLSFSFCFSCRRAAFFSWFFLGFGFLVCFFCLLSVFLSNPIFSVLLDS
jgi:lipopolysaccharide export LptBFGC system permease protein LptF